MLLNVWIFSKLRGSGESTTVGLMVRGAIASALSQAVDSVIFITLAFYGSFPIMNLMIGQIIAKVVLSLVLVPFLITGGVMLWDEAAGELLRIETSGAVQAIAAAIAGGIENALKSP